MNYSLITYFSVNTVSRKCSGVAVRTLSLADNIFLSIQFIPVLIGILDITYIYHQFVIYLHIYTYENHFIVTWINLKILNLIGENSISQWSQ